MTIFARIDNTRCRKQKTITRPIRRAGRVSQYSSSDIRTAIKFLTWLDENHLDLAAGGQEDLDLWLTTEYGSTANHSIAGGGDSVPWFNDRRPFGIWETGESGEAPVPYSEAADTALLRGFYSSFDFHPSVFVGDQATSTFRLVRGVAAPAVGQTVALSGAKSGLVVSTIRSTKFWDEGTGAYSVLMWTSTCVDGDSGAPWLTTMGSQRRLPRRRHCVGSASQ